MSVCRRRCLRRRYASVRQRLLHSRQTVRISRNPTNDTDRARRRRAVRCRSTDGCSANERARIQTNPNGRERRANTPRSWHYLRNRPLPTPIRTGLRDDGQGKEKPIEKTVPIGFSKNSKFRQNGMWWAAAAAAVAVRAAAEQWPSHSFACACRHTPPPTLSSSSSWKKKKLCHRTGVCVCACGGGGVCCRARHRPSFLSIWPASREFIARAFIDNAEKAAAAATVPQFFSGARENVKGSPPPLINPFCSYVSIHIVRAVFTSVRKNL